MVEVTAQEIREQGVDSLFRMARQEPVKLSFRNDKPLVVMPVGTLEEFEEFEREKAIRELKEARNAMAKEAQANGLTEEKLEQILKEIDDERTQEMRSV